jgi:Cu/Ag efflux protein CusF
MSRLRDRLEPEVIRQMERTMKAHVHAIITALCLGLMACSSQSKPNDAQAPATSAPQAQSDTQPQRYPLKGKVVAVDKPGKKVTIDHEAIPGFMGAMTMAYPVKDEHQLDNVSAGELITATVVSGGGEYWVENISAADRAAPAK